MTHVRSDEGRDRRGSLRQLVNLDALTVPEAGAGDGGAGSATSW
jgi:hypothetical protein